MAEFKNLLFGYREKLTSYFLTLTRVADLINEITGLKIESKNLKIKDSFVLVKIKPKEKLLILINKERIISRFKEENLNLIDLK